MGSKGIVASTAALAVLLQEGIGDTIRISLTPEPGGDRTQEVRVGAGNPADHGAARVHAAGHRLPRLRPHHPHRVPGTGAGHPEPICASRCRCGAAQYPGVETMHVAVMGCVVNGPGESKHANIGISLPGTGEVPVAPVYVDGEKTVTLKGERIAEEFQAIVDDYVRSHYGSAREPRFVMLIELIMSNCIQSVRGMNDCLPEVDRHLAGVRGDRARLAAALRLPRDAHADPRTHRRCSSAPSAR